jgi:hypothetical protein
MPTIARVAGIHEYGPPEVLGFEDIGLNFGYP